MLARRLFFLNLGPSSELFFHELRDILGGFGLQLWPIDEEALHEIGEDRREIVLAIVNGIQGLKRIRKIKEGISHPNKRYILIEARTFGHMEQRTGPGDHTYFIDLPIKTSVLAQQILSLYLQYTVPRHILDLI
jgi:hypothetical protein